MPRDLSKATAASRAKHLAKHPDILELARQGLSRPEIAHRLGVSVRTVARVRAEAGLVSYRRATEEDKLRAKAMLNDGASYAEVSRTIGFGHKEIKRWFPGYTWTVEQRNEAAVMARQLAGLEWMRGTPSTKQKRPWEYA